MACNTFLFRDRKAESQYVVLFRVDKEEKRQDADKITKRTFLKADTAESFCIFDILFSIFIQALLPLSVNSLRYEAEQVWRNYS